ncbi:response regulator [Microvirga aerophila]|uniref:response regulator n=1 Tax=Microvirga aerophila TaxID=670291 RepID=UPI000DF00824|nr:response regulator [Microvirga aerophila]
MNSHGNDAPLVLILEDEVLIGINLQDDLQDAGFRVAGPFTTCSAALEWLQTATPDTAILDAALRDGPCREIAQELGNRAVPFLIYSGYGPDQELLAAFHRITWIEKPVPPSALVQACQELLVSES